MNKKLIRRIIAWVGLVGAVAFAPLLVINFYDLGSDSANTLIDSLLWTSLALTIIAFGIAKFLMVERVDLDEAFPDATETEDGETDIESSEDDVVDTESCDGCEKEDDESSQEKSAGVTSSEEDSK